MEERDHRTKYSQIPEDRPLAEVTHLAEPSLRLTMIVVECEHEQNLTRVPMSVTTSNTTCTYATFPCSGLSTWSSLYT